MAAGTPCPGLCGVEIVHPDGGALPGEPSDRRHLAAGLERGRGHGDHRECRDPQERSQQAVGVIVPGRGPGDVENMPELADPFPVRRTQANRFFPGEQVVFGEPIRAFPGATGIEDAIDIEQQSGARHLSSMDAASCDGSRAGQRRGRCGRGCGGVHKPHQTLPPLCSNPGQSPNGCCRTRDENESLRKFLVGEPDDLLWMQNWRDLLSEATAQGRRFSRVRVVSLPLTDYCRFGVWCAQFANRAGEDIRYLDRGQAGALKLPDHDYWLFDSRLLLRMHFDDQDVFLGGEVVKGRRRDREAQLLA
jgi:hypothetical protein